jgi:hypothetical protein
LIPLGVTKNIPHSKVGDILCCYLQEFERVAIFKHILEFLE